MAQIGDNGEERPIAYASTALSKAQKGYTLSEAEAAAMMWALRKWRHITKTSSSTTVVITDHSAVCSLQNPSKQFNNRRLANYAAELADMDVVIAHRSGRVHYMTDWLSRCMYEDAVRRGGDRVATSIQ